MGLCRFLVSAALPGVLACGGTLLGPEDASKDPARLVGRQAPAFSVAPATGPAGAAPSDIVLDRLHGDVVLVDFWGTYCGPCRRSLPHLQALSARYEADGLRVVGISEDGADDGKVAAFAKAHGLKFALAWDQDGAIARRYGPESVPSSFLIDRQGIVRYTHVGYHPGDEVEIEREIKELLSSASN
jgi:peroxiredoxin